MSVGQAAQQLCDIENERVSPAVRRRELVELAAVVTAALAINAASKSSGAGAALLWVNVATQLALPFAAAWTLRRTASRHALAAASVLELGLLAAMLFANANSLPQALTLHAMTATGMVWVLAANPRRSMRTTLLAAAIVSMAIAIAALI